MTQSPDQRQTKKPNLYSKNRLIWIGALLILGATVGLTLQLNRLLTPGNFPVGTDPSFDLALAAFFALVFIFGGLLLWRGVGEYEKRLEVRLEKFLNFATAILSILLVLDLIAGTLLYSANRRFAASFVPVTHNEPPPADSMPSFASPILAQPTPTYNPTSKFMAGTVNSAMDGFRVGDIWISLAPDLNSIRFIQVYMNRIQCNLQDGASGTVLAVDKSQLLFNGSVRIQNDRTFYTAQEKAVIHGIIGDTTNQGYGTVYLRYTDPATQKTCDLGSFNWTATMTQ